MNRILLICLLATAAAPAFAQEQEPRPNDYDVGFLCDSYSTGLMNPIVDACRWIGPESTAPDGCCAMRAWDGRCLMLREVDLGLWSQDFCEPAACPSRCVFRTNPMDYDCPRMDPETLKCLWTPPDIDPSCTCTNLGGDSGGGDPTGEEGEGSEDDDPELDPPTGGGGEGESGGAGDGAANEGAGGGSSGGGSATTTPPGGGATGGGSACPPGEECEVRQE